MQATAFEPMGLIVIFKTSLGIFYSEVAQRIQSETKYRYIIGILKILLKSSWFKKTIDRVKA